MRYAFLALLLVLAGAASARAQTPPVESMLGLRATHERPLERGRSTLLSLSLVLAPGLRLLEEGPLLIELEGVAIDPAQRDLGRRDAIDPRAELPRFELEVRPHREGTPTLNAKLTAWACRGQRCRPVEVRVPIPLTMIATVPPRGPQPPSR